MKNRFNLWLISGLWILIACNGNPFEKVEPTTTDPVVRARELNDSAIDLFSRGDRFGEDALRIFNEAHDLDSNYDKPIINKIAVLMQLRRFDDAKIVCNELLNKRPNDADVLALIGMLYKISGDEANAEAYFNEGCNQLKNNIGNLDSTGLAYSAHINKLALLYWVSNQPDETERLVPGMTKEEKPSDHAIAAEFWKNIRPM